MKKLILILFACLVSAINAFADSFTVDGITLNNVETNTLNIGLQNNSSAVIVGFQFNLYLPEGVSPVMNNNMVVITVSDRFRGTYWLRGSKVADGSYLFTYLSSDGNGINECSGTLFSIKLQNLNAIDGNYTANITKATITNNNGEGQDLADTHFTINIEHKYNLTYRIDEVDYKTVIYTVGESITPEPQPLQEGHTFSGWSEIPETMPAKDVTVTGSFSVNNYTLSYVVDGVTYSTESIAYGTELKLKNNLTKEGHTFSGWSEIPETMPASDVTVTGSFTINSYIITYMIDENIFLTDTLLYNEKVTTPVAPEKEGYTFVEWINLPNTMPASDLTVTAKYTVSDGVDYIKDDEYNRVYDLTGKFIGKMTIDELSLLKPGIYIINSQKIIIR